jgi:micrococcal nuclease
MFLRRKKFIFSLIVFLLLVFYQRLSPTEQVLSEKIQPSPSVKIEQATKQEAQITRVVDGDTIEVLLNGSKEKVRVIGINTPETVDPRKPVECFGREASNFAKGFLANQIVSLESDPTQQERDKYGRLLRYIFVNEVDFGKLMIEQGYAHEYTYDLPYKYQLEYKEAEKEAREGKVGLWKSTSCANGSS